jgi:hypothetical protein
MRLLSRRVEEASRFWETRLSKSNRKRFESGQVTHLLGRNVPLARMRNSPRSRYSRRTRSPTKKALFLIPKVEVERISRVGAGRRRESFPIMDTMSQTHTAATSSSNYQSIFDNTLEAYKKKTKNDLLSHPLLSKLESCDSPDDILTVLQDHILGLRSVSWYK